MAPCDGSGLNNREPGASGSGGSDSVEGTSDRVLDRRLLVRGVAWSGAE